LIPKSSDREGGIAVLSDDTFAGRIHEQDAFRDVLSSIQDKRSTTSGDGFLVLVSGHGGIGKSTLLRRFTAITDGDFSLPGFKGQFFRVYIDFDVVESGSAASSFGEITPDRLMWRLASDIGATASSRQDKRLIRKALEDFYKKFSTLRRDKPRNATRVAGEVSGWQTGASLAGETVGSIATIAGAAPFAKPISAATEMAFGKIGSAFDSRKEVRELTAGEIDPLRPCLDALSRGILEISQSRPVVFILDTCEILGSAGAALRTLIQMCGARVCWVVGARLEPSESASDESDTFRYIHSVAPAHFRLLELGGFDASVIHSLLSDQIVQVGFSGFEVTQLERLTRGIPLAVALVIKMLKTGINLNDLIDEVIPGGDSAKIVRVLAERYLRHVSTVPALSADLPLLQGVALLPEKVDDYELLAALWGVSGRQVSAKLRELAGRHDFIFSGRLGSPQNVMHREIRETLRKHLRDADQRISVKEMNLRAISHLKRKLRDSRLKNIERQLNDDEEDDHAIAWQADTSALVWHTFWVDSPEGIALIRRLYPAAALLAPDLARAQAEIARFQLGAPNVHARRLLTIINTVAAGTGGKLPHPMAAQALLDLEGVPVADGPSASDIPSSVYCALLRLNWCRAGIIDQAIKDRTVQLIQISNRLAEHYGEQDAAVRRTAAAVANEARQLGLSAAQKQNYKDAVTAFTVAVRWLPDDFTAHGNLALAYATLGEAAASAESFKRAIRLNPDDAAMHAAFGELMILAKSGDLYGRREALDWAIRKSSTDQLQPLVLRGLVAQALAQNDETEEPEQYFERALNTESSRRDFQESEMKSIALAGLGHTEMAAAEFSNSAETWTPANKFRVAIYDILATRNRAGSEVLIAEWQRILHTHPEAAFPWG
jgi:Tfp pilus assembly protein PilF